jgi:hypothetical protein
MTHCHHLILLCNTTIEEDNNTLSSSSSFQTQRKQNTQDNNQKKNQEGKELTFKLMFCPLTFGCHFYPFVSNAFSLHLLLFKQKKRKENYKEKNKCKERKVLSFKFPLCPLTFGSRFYPFVSNAFSLHLLLLKQKKKTKEKKP